MPLDVSNVLDVLRDYGIEPADLDGSAAEPPGIGQIEEGEAVYPTSIERIFGDDDGWSRGEFTSDDDPRLLELWETVRDIRAQQAESWWGKRPDRPHLRPPEERCAWYCPIHYFGHGWGIYIREACIIEVAQHIADYTVLDKVKLSPKDLIFQLLRSAFYVFFLHEQFHHKVESLGFRLLVATGVDRYRPYKENVYRPTFLTPACLEESLANAESYRRLSEPRYVARVDRLIRDGVRKYLKASIPHQPGGYAQGVDYLTDVAYRDGLHRLQSQIRDGHTTLAASSAHWAVAPNMITALADITDDIYVVLPVGARPIFRSTRIAPAYTVSTNRMVSALTRHHGYDVVPGGKGSHVKLKKPGAPTIVLPGNRPVLAPGIVKHALDAVGGYPLSRLPDLLEGRLAVHA